MSNPILALKDALRHGEDDLEMLFDMCLRDRVHLMNRIHVKDEIHDQLLFNNKELREQIKALEKDVAKLEAEINELESK